MAETTLFALAALLVIGIAVALLIRWNGGNDDPPNPGGPDSYA